MCKVFSLGCPEDREDPWRGDLREGKKQKDKQSLRPPAIRRVRGDSHEGRNRIRIQLRAVRPGKHRAAHFIKVALSSFRDPIFHNFFVLNLSPSLS